MLYDLLVSAVASVGTEQMSTGHLVPLFLPLSEFVNTHGTMETVGSVLYERLKKKYIFDPKSGVIEEATPETYVEDTYLTKK